MAEWFVAPPPSVPLTIKTALVFPFLAPACAQGCCYSYSYSYCNCCGNARGEKQYVIIEEWWRAYMPGRKKRGFPEGGQSPQLDLLHRHPVVRDDG